MATLLEDLAELDEAAGCEDGDDCISTGCWRRERQLRLREHARRLREEMADHRQDPRIWPAETRRMYEAIGKVLARINGGGTPGNTRGEPESLTASPVRAERGENGRNWEAEAITLLRQCLGTAIVVRYGGDIVDVEMKIAAFLADVEQREREARPKESASCPAWEDGSHCYETVDFATGGGTIKYHASKRCACGKAIGRAK